MRFPIRNIFPRWQIWVHCLSVHSFHLLPFCCYVLSVAQLLLFSGDFGITRLHSGTTCILEHFFRTYMFPFVHSTKKRCRSTLHRSHMLKTVFVCALAGCISKATPHNKAKRTVLPAHSFWQNGLRLEFSQKAYGFKPPGRACQPEADSLTRI